tara:strand:- start:1937 stop:2479 length:543 start_codon:yes stop_codon:yes gene_type:complete
MKLFNVVKTDVRDWKIIGGKIATRIVKDSDLGISQDGNKKKFKGYSNRNANVGYRFVGKGKKRRLVYIDSYVNKKKAGKAAPKGVSASKQINPPNLRLTGKMLDSIKAQNPTKTSVEILYADGAKVMGNAKPPKWTKKPRRNIYGLNQDNQNFIEDYLAKKIENNIFKYVAKDIKLDLKL